MKKIYIAASLVFLMACSVQVNNEIYMEDKSNVPKEETDPTEDTIVKDDHFFVNVDEFTTDLSDNHFVNIQLQLITDTEQGKQELERRSFQVRNILLKEITLLTTSELDDFESSEASIRNKLNELIGSGQVTKINVLKNVVQ